MLEFGEEGQENGQPQDCWTELKKMLNTVKSWKQNQFSSVSGRDGASDKLLSRPALYAYRRRYRQQGLFARIRYHFPTIFRGIGD